MIGLRRKNCFATDKNVDMTTEEYPCMADLLPSTPDTSAAETNAPRVIGLNEDDADNLIEALSSATARSMLTELHTEPAPASELASRCETTIQNAQYHIEQLDDAGLIEVIDTVYSEKGREMDVYAPADRPLVVIAGDSTQAKSIKDRLPEFLGGLGLLGAASLVVQAILGDRLIPRFAEEPTVATDDVVEDVETTADPYALDDALGLPPGALFFLGGLAVLTGLLAYQYWRT